MFKTITSNKHFFEQLDANSIIRQLLNDEVIVVSQELMQSAINAKLKPKELVVIDTIPKTVKYLSDKYAFQTWWILCDYEMLNSLIINGSIMDVYIVKNFNKHIHDSSSSIKALLEQPELGFELVSITRDDTITPNDISHYFRCNHEEVQLLITMHEIISTGFIRPSRTGVPTRSIFGKQFEYMMVERIDPITGKSSFRFPMLTTKKMFIRGVFAELQWFLNGDTNSKTLESQGVNIWKGNSSRAYLNNHNLTNYQEGECGPIYGHQWRSWSAPYVIGKSQYRGEGIDQVQKCIDSLRNDPFGRRHIISGWNVDQLDEMALPPCHVLYQFFVHEDNNQIYLSLSMYQRSADTFLGVPFNVCSMGIFLMMMAHTLNYKPYKIVHSIGDMHIYETHIDAATKQLMRTPCMFPYISIDCEPKDALEDYEYANIHIEGYSSYPSIKADMVA
jgi:thymidylate synthase